MGDMRYKVCGWRELVDAKGLLVEMVHESRQATVRGTLKGVFWEDEGDDEDVVSFDFVQGFTLIIDRDDSDEWEFRYFPPTPPAILTQNGSPYVPERRRSVVNHIKEWLDSVPVGTVATIAEVANFATLEYGDDRPSPGAIAARCFPSDEGRKLNLPGLECLDTRYASPRYRLRKVEVRDED